MKDELDEYGDFTDYKDSITLYPKEITALKNGEVIEYKQNTRPCVVVGKQFDVGDVLWVQESHARTEHKDPFTRPHYFADGELTLDLRHDAGLLKTYSEISMPKWASRMNIRVLEAYKDNGSWVYRLELDSIA